MGKRTVWICAIAALAGTAALGSAPAAAYTSVGVQIGIPAPVYVSPAVPVYQYTPMAQGNVWVPGHWEWQGNRHSWVHGYYAHPRASYPTRYDRDGDGIPDRYDRDRDGDGVPNRFDRAPDNRYRY
ncbi:MAG: hypothetical protein JWQ07_3243 [Ramlibacter sp.]|nr:hypothetical protein [Ramlibacter sp.]